MAEDKKKIITVIFIVTLILSSITIFVSVNYRNPEIPTPIDAAAETPEGSLTIGGRLYCTVSNGQLALSDIEVEIIDSNREIVALTTNESGFYSYSGFTEQGIYTVAVDGGQFEDDPETESVGGQTADQSQKYCGGEAQNYDRCNFVGGNVFTDIDFSFSGCEQLTGLLVTPTPEVAGTNGAPDPLTDSSNSDDVSQAASPTPVGNSDVVTTPAVDDSLQDPINPITNDPNSDIVSQPDTNSPLVSPTDGPGTLPSTAIFEGRSRVILAAIILAVGVYAYNKKNSKVKNEDNFWNDYV